MTRKPAPQFYPGLPPRRRDDQLNEMSRDLYTIYGGISVAPPLAMSQDVAGTRLWVNLPRTFLARLTAVYTPSSGPQTGLNLYSFIEQLIDQTSGIPQDNPSGVQTIGSAPPANNYALEANNALLTVPGSTPPGYSNPGPYVVMELKNVVNGAPVYEFTYAPDPFAYLINTNVNDQEPISPVPIGPPFVIGLTGRTFSASMSSGSNLLNSSTANFTSSDIGKIVLGTGVANWLQGNPLANAPTTITAINSSTQAVMSANATANVTNGTIGIAIEWILGYVMHKTLFNFATNPFGPQDPWPDDSANNVYMVTEREGGMDNSGYANYLNNEMVNGIYPVCEQIYRGKYVGTDIFGEPIYESRVDPMEWFWEVPNPTSTSSITLEGTGQTVTAYSAQLLQYNSNNTPKGFHHNTSSPVGFGAAYWYDAENYAVSVPPPNGVIQSRQVDCTTTGIPVFSGYGKVPLSQTASFSYVLSGSSPQNVTGASLTLSQPGTYLIVCTIPGSLSASTGGPGNLSLEADITNTTTSTAFGPRVTVVSTLVPDGLRYGTATIMDTITITTTPQTLQLGVLVSGSTGSFGGGQVGQNYSGTAGGTLKAIRVD